MSTLPHINSPASFLASKENGQPESSSASANPPSSETAAVDIGAMRIRSLTSAAASPSEEFLQRLETVKTARNPLLLAADVLFVTLARMRTVQLHGRVEVEVLRELLKREVQHFQKLCERAQVKREHAVAASYCLCTALDEAAGSTEWGFGEDVSDVGPWAGDMLAKTFHGDIDGGRKVFLLIGRLSSQAEQHLDLLEVLYRIVCLGFKGQYVSAEHGRQHLDTIRHRLHALLQAGRDAVPRELSVRWRSEFIGTLRRFRGVPVWCGMLLLGVLLLGGFGWYKYKLLGQGDALAVQMLASTHILPAPASRDGAIGLSQLLKSEIAAGAVLLNEQDGGDALIVNSDAMFTPGGAQVNAATLALLEKVAHGVATSTAAVQVIGHSDDRPIRTRAFPDNQVLSEARAQAVADVLRLNGVNAARLEVLGRGADQPLTANATAAGRARNRRVEILIARRAPPRSAISDAGPATTASSFTR